jgi:hypothetical protein
MRYFDFEWLTGSWCRTGEWTWGIDRPPCGNHCVILWCGFFVISIYRGTCRLEHGDE